MQMHTLSSQYITLISTNMSPEQQQDNIEAQEMSVRDAETKEHIIYVKDLSEVEQQEWENRVLNDNNVIELYDGELVIAYQVIPTSDYEDELSETITHNIFS